jgi:hypothetical protein
VAATGSATKTLRVTQSLKGFQKTAAAAAAANSCLSCYHAMLHFRQVLWNPCISTGGLHSQCLCRVTLHGLCTVDWMKAPAGPECAVHNSMGFEVCA